MGNWWQIINIDKRESSQHLWGQLGSWFFYPHEHLLSHISIPCLPPDVDEWLTEGATALQSGPLAHMPVEILDLFFDERRGLHEVIYLAITCKHLLNVGKRHVLRASREYYAPWVGCRLISLDDSTRSLDDLPPNMLTQGEVKEIEETSLSDCEFEEVERSLSNFSARYCARVFHREWKQPRINDAHNFVQRLYGWRTPPSPAEGNEEVSEDSAVERDVNMFKTLYGDGRHPSYPAGVRVLCNLSKGEYVRADGLTVPTYANLAHALLARICWTSHQDVGMVCADDYRPQLTGGAWAGDRFCVTSLNSLAELEIEAGATEWKDMTSEVSDLLTHIWENNSLRWVVFCK
ncbi:hypothetical protein DICSQDRAFT_135787 [Dichomitus squalens LYAD-421 SS1]|uniref:Uncharacterized protein n=1 Tax=Dichomitus squalens (strain LYAD-421) TaxID=732165 RepID=R7T1S8_DICSQ|nr:uncharacterized protein DICSQDRAFT_135787 [Dichomitus squalens LYAD-421 SS1]EJF62193.1 hypothetical protein DICSQDRAFT_135787 [Dichomitus squalens LYAD-421 SS1]